ncbi:MAG: ParM/StbA family protein, partial [Anaerolineae bacterium]|nr:ParM/StbA family protein [Anaerolineae bacterium]
MEETTRNLGLDPGFGGFKAALVDPTGTRIATVPSVVGVGETDLGLLSLGSMGRRSHHAQPDEVTSQGVTYLVGEGVARYARPVERMDFLRLSDGPELRALFYDVVFRLMGDGRHRLNVMAGLPVEVMADRQQAQSTLRALRRWMIGTHTYQVIPTGTGGGCQVELFVDDVQVMAQPAGAVFAWGLDDHGRWTRARADLKAPIAVCDIGYNTLDLFTVQGGEVIGRFTGGDTAGMRRSAELILTAVRGGHGLALSLYEADALLRARRPTLYTAEGEVDLSQL